MMYLRIHESTEGRIVAACDKELIGKVLDNGNVFMDLKRYQGFYKGRLVKENELQEALHNFTSLNLVGKKAVGAILRMQLINENDVRYINTIPYVQVYKI
jgi:hypothetical protein